MKNLGYFWRKGLWALSSLFFLLFFVSGLLYIYLESQLPDVESLKTIQLQVPLRVYTQDGLLIQEYGEKRRIPVAYEDIPKPLIQALLATEDQRFFEHSGVDVFGLARAAVRMVQTGTKSQGGSTITMQVARNFFLDRKKTFLRKFNEILLAIKIDHELSKEKILELYLNKIYLGNRAYGVGAAAQIYFGKSLKELSLAQLAMIAGLPQAPSTQNPIVNPAAAKKRRNHVLDRLLEEKYITKEQHQEAIHQPITAIFHGSDIDISALYVAEMIRQSLYDHFGEAAYTKGYKVYTTIQSSLQTAANKAVEKNLLAYDHRHGYRGPITNVGKINPDSPKEIHRLLANYPTLNDIEPAIIVSVSDQTASALLRNGVKLTLPWKGLSWARPALKNSGWVGRAPSTAKQVVSVGDIVSVRLVDNSWQLTQIPDAEAALIALNPSTGAIQALVGGFNFQKSKYNRVTQSSRQPGSDFKPFIYAAALNKGYSLATQINDAPVVVNDPSLGAGGLWRPHNDHKDFNGPTRLKEALIRSLNLVSIHILDDIGIDYAIDFVSRFGFNKKGLPHTLSLALGTLSVTPMDLAAAYAVFANGGFKIEPFLIDHITDSDGKQLLQAKPSSACASCSQASTGSTQRAPRIISEEIAFLMNSSLMDVVQLGTAKQARELNRRDIAGKTGTTNDQFDAWFSGYNPDLVVTTWVGFDTPQPLHEYGAQLALPLWIDFMKVALAGKPEHPIQQPEDIVAIKISPSTGLRTESTNGLVEYFRKDEIPSMDEGITSTAQNTPSGNNEESLF
jgi:penicillin-binding protein 1A